MSTNPQHTSTDELGNIVLANVNDFGWHCVNVIEDDSHPPWSYTIGFYETWGFPELIVIGRSRATAHYMLNTIADKLDNNERPPLDQPTGNLLTGMKCRFIEVLPRYYSDYVGFARSFYRKRQFPIYQLVWSNGDGQYPWHPSVPKLFKEWQPVLGATPKDV